MMDVPQPNCSHWPCLIGGMPLLCGECGEERAALRRPKTAQPVLRSLAVPAPEKQKLI